MRRSWSRWTPLLLLLLAFALRLYHLDYQELRGDEAFGYFFSLRPYDEIIGATIELAEPHPTASYFVQKAWMTLAGHSEFALRFSTTWFGLLAVALIYRLGRRLTLGAAASVGAMALMAVSPYLIWHTQDARMYSTSLALTLASTWLAIEWQLRAGQRLRWLWAVAYVAISLLALHTHYFAAFVLIAQYLYFVGIALWYRQWRMLVQWLLLQGTVFLLYLPWLIRAAQTLTSYGGNGDSPNLIASLQRAASVFAAGESVPEAQRVGIALLATILLLLGTWRLVQSGAKTRRAALLLWLYLAVPLLATWLSALQRPIFNERYLVAAAPPFYLLIASVLVRAPASTASRQRSWFRYSGALLLLVLIVGSLVSLNRHYHDNTYSKTRGWRQLAFAIDRYGAGIEPERVRIAQNFPDPTLWYYYDGAIEHVVLPPTPHDQEGARLTVSGLADAGVERVILPVQPAAQWDDANLASSALATAYQPIHETAIGVWPVAVFDRQGTQLPATAIPFENGLNIVGMDVLPDTLSPGGLLSVRLAWQGDASTLAGDEKVTIQLLGTDGTVVAQVDRDLTPNQFSRPSNAQEAYGMLLPEDLALDDHQLIVALYVPTAEGTRRILTKTGEDAVTIWQTRR